MRDYFFQIHDMIQDLFGCDSYHARTEFARITLGGHLAWAGQVEIFDLQNSPRADRCFAWDFLRETGDWNITMQLAISPVLTAEAAVRAAIAERAQGGNSVRLFTSPKRRTTARRFR